MMSSGIISLMANIGNSLLKIMAMKMSQEVTFECSFVRADSEFLICLQSSCTILKITPAFIGQY